MEQPRAARFNKSRTAVWLGLVLSLFAFVAGLGTVLTSVRMIRRHQVVVYYANETTSQAAHSVNYAILLRVLRESSNPSASALADEIVRDTTEYPEAARSDIKGLLTDAKRHHFDLAVFTNAMALDQKYLFYRSSTDTSEFHSLAELPGAPSAPLAVSPLSRPGYFQAALTEVAALYQPDSLDIILITSSHGGGDLALTPRVFADLTHVKPENLLAAVNRPNEDASVRRQWASYPGTTKVEYWRVLSRVSAEHGVRFPLVLRAACDSTISSWDEFFAIPGSVGLVAHTGHRIFQFNQLDYAKIFNFNGRRSQLANHVSAALENQGIYVQSRASLWFWPMENSLTHIPLTLYFIPLILWLLWIVAAKVGLRLPRIGVRLISKDRPL